MGIQTPMAQGQSTKIISIKIKWIWTSRSSIKNSLSSEGYEVRLAQTFGRSETTYLHILVHLVKYGSG